MTNPAALLFTDLDQELQEEPLQVIGVFPDWLQGTLFRNGPAKFGSGHLFDGLAMIHKFSINHGHVIYSNRFLRTPAYEQVMNGKETFGFGTKSDNGEQGHNTNVNIVRMDHHFAALTESPDIIEFDPYSLDTMGLLPYGDRFPGHYSTAHPHYDYKQKSLFNFTVEFGPVSKYHLYAKPDGQSKRSLIASIETQSPAYMHSFAITENYVVLVEFPLIFNPLELMQSEKAIADCMHWTPGKGTRFLVVGKHSGKLERVVDCDSFFSFHHINAFEKQGDIFIDACAMKQTNMGGLGSADSAGFSAENQPEMLRFKLTAARTSAEVQKLSKEWMEFPRIYYSGYNTAEYQYAYGTSTNQAKPEAVENQLIKVDTRTGSTKVWYREGHYPGEPVFTPAPHGKDEDDGIILSVVLDGHAGKSYLLALDAKTFEELATATVPHPIPFGFHGLYTDELFQTEG
ncbi:Carotenoid cleavage dioxygenase [Paenibacillaceae bacterium GAS479]|nr:Carotenoid cleavage dioxygenase [Paenibacillaceae bacterium GAS479]